MHYLIHWARVTQKDCDVILRIGVGQLKGDKMQVQIKVRIDGDEKSKLEEIGKELTNFLEICTDIFLMSKGSRREE